ncbi:MAG: hypothetical protein JW934_04295 [Anaerolineae bacterium]|nr:hypothetical protein [Anaerolineae bacterium]
MRSPWIVAFVHPLNLFMLMAAAAAGLVSAWWMFPLGLLFWLIMVAMVARDPALKINAGRDGRASLARRFQRYFDRIERAQVNVFNSLSNASAEIKRAMQPVQSEMESLVNRTHALCHRMTNLDNYRLVTESQSTSQNDLKRIDEAIAQAQDPLVRQEYEESRRSLQARQADQQTIVEQLDRVEAQLLSLANEMDGVVADVLRLQALGGQEAQRQSAQLAQRLRREQAELARFEQEAIHKKS